MNSVFTPTLPSHFLRSRWFRPPFEGTRLTYLFDHALRGIPALTFAARASSSFPGAFPSQQFPVCCARYDLSLVPITSLAATACPPQKQFVNPLKVRWRRYSLCCGRPSNHSESKFVYLPSHSLASFSFVKIRMESRALRLPHQISAKLRSSLVSATIAILDSIDRTFGRCQAASTNCFCSGHSITLEILTI